MIHDKSANYMSKNVLLNDKKPDFQDLFHDFCGDLCLYWFKIKVSIGRKLPKITTVLASKEAANFIMFLGNY